MMAGGQTQSFRAGRMDWDGRMVTPDKRKGKVVLFTSEEEQLTHFQWHDREKNEVVTDLIVINDAYLEKIEKCTTGRVYILRFTSSDKKLFFWMQEPNEEGDAELIKKFNDFMGATIPEKKSEAAAGAAPAAPVAPPSSGAVPQFWANELMGNQGLQEARSPPIPLEAVLTTDVVTSLLTDEAATAEMIPLLPDGQTNQADLREALTSPQFRQSLHSLTQAIHSDQLPVLLASLGLNPNVINATPNADALEILCRAMEAQFGQGPNAEGGSGGGN